MRAIIFSAVVLTACFSQAHAQNQTGRLCGWHKVCSYWDPVRNRNDSCLFFGPTVVDQRGEPLHCPCTVVAHPRQPGVNVTYWGGTEFKRFPC